MEDNKENHEPSGKLSSEVGGKQLEVLQVQEKDRIINRVCPSSGKALGGHMRSHVHHENILQPKQPPQQEANASINGNQKPTCLICGKSFNSMKSLYGHMRCHPERCWRGIKPPPSASSSPCHSLPYGTPVVDLTESLPGWSVTAKRGREGISNATASSSSEDTLSEAELLLEVAHLMGEYSLNSDRTHKQSHDSNSLTFTEIEDSSGVSEKKTEKRRIEAYPDGYGRESSMNSSKIEAMGSTALNSVLVAEDQSGTGKESDIVQQLDCGIGKVNLMQNGRERKKMKLVDLEDLSPESVTTTATLHKYRCSSCTKGFSTCQALGGHMSSHSKIRMNIQKKPMDESSAAPEIQANLTCSQLSGNGKSVANWKVGHEWSHKCLICNKFFPTGQALGGHKRTHWTGLVKTPAIQVIYTGESSRNASPKGLDFDLNEFPALVEEEDGTNESIESKMAALGERTVELVSFLS